MGQITEWAKPVIECDEHNAILDQGIGLVDFRGAGSGLMAATMDPDHDRQQRFTSDIRSPDIDEEAVFGFGRGRHGRHILLGSKTLPPGQPGTINNAVDETVHAFSGLKAFRAVGPHVTWHRAPLRWRTGCRPAARRRIGDAVVDPNIGIAGINAAENQPLVNP